MGGHDSIPREVQTEPPDPIKAVPSRPVHTGETRGPLTFAQEARMTRHLERPEGRPAKHENLTRAFALDPGLDTDALRKAAALVVRRQTALRTRFEKVEGTWQQVITATTSPEFFVITEQQDPRARHADRALLDEWAQKPLSRTDGRLLRLVIIKGAERDVLLVSGDHLVVDAWGFATVLRELDGAYAAVAQRRIEPPPNLPYSFLDYARWSRDSLRRGEWDHTIRYWQAQLSGVQDIGTLDLPIAVNLKDRILEVETISLELDESVSARLQALVYRARTTLFVALVAATAAATRIYATSDDLLFVNYFANRLLPGTKDLVGWLATTLFLRVPLSPADSLGSLLSDCRRVVLGAVQHEQLHLAALRPFLPETFTRQPTTANLSVAIADELTLGTRESPLGALHPTPISVLAHSAARGRVSIVMGTSAERFVLTASSERGRFQPGTLQQLLTRTAISLRCLTDNLDISVAKASEQLPAHR